MSIIIDVNYNCVHYCCLNGSRDDHLRKQRPEHAVEPCLQDFAHREDQCSRRDISLYKARLRGLSRYIGRIFGHFRPVTAPDPPGEKPPEP